MRISDWSSDVCSSDLLRDVTHKRAIDLERINGEVLEVAQRRIAGSKVVDQYMRTHLAEMLQQAGRPLGILHDHALGDLKLQAIEIGRASCRERVGQYV